MRLLASLLPLLLLPQPRGADPKLKQEAIALVEQRATRLATLSDQVWCFA